MTADDGGVSRIPSSESFSKKNKSKKRRSRQKSMSEEVTDVSAMDRKLSTNSIRSEDDPEEISDLVMASSPPTCKVLL